MAHTLSEDISVVYEDDAAARAVVKEGGDSKPFVETAHDWLQRSRRKRSLDQTAHSPSSAAWAFFRSGSTGIHFIDTILRRNVSVDQLPVIDLRGTVGKTTTLSSLAARFVVSTRPTQFQTQSNGVTDDRRSIPRAIILDTLHGMSLSKIVYVVRAALLRQLKTDSDEQSFQDDMEGCLERIHILTTDNPSEWISILEGLRCDLEQSADDFPTLILWDDFLADAGEEATRMEIIRQITRLLESCSTVLVTASSAPRRQEWNKHVSHRARLDHQEALGDREFLATVNGAQIPFSISSSGVV